MIALFLKLIDLVKIASSGWFQQPHTTTGLSGFAEYQGHSAKPNLHSAKALLSATLGKGHSAKNGPAKASLPSARHSAKLEPKKTRKNGIFLIGGGPHRPAPAHLRHFSRKIRSYEAGGIRIGDLSLARPLL